MNNASGDKTAFDVLLSDYLDGSLKKELKAIGLTKISIYVDWLDKVKCIGIQGKCQMHYIDMQIYQMNFVRHMI